MTSPLEKEVLNALFRQEKPIIFSLKAGLEKLGKGHHKTSHMNRNQHADVLMKGLEATKGSKQDWTEGNLWGRVLDFANKKKPLNDIRLNAIWELVKKNNKWSDEYAKVGTEVIDRGRFGQSGRLPKKAVGEVEGTRRRKIGRGGDITFKQEVPVVPEGPGGSVLGASAPAPAARPEPDKQLLKAKDDRIALLEKRNRELLNELQAIKRAEKVELGRVRESKERYKKGEKSLLRRLAFYEGGKEGRIAELTEEYDPEEKIFQFKNMTDSLSRGNISEFSDFILLGIEDEIILFDKDNGLFYDKEGGVIGKGEFSIPGDSVIKNVDLSDLQFEERISGKRKKRGRELPLKTQIKNLNIQINSYMNQEDYGEEDGADPFIVGPYGPKDDEIIIEELPPGSGNFVVVDNEDGETIADWDRQKGMINEDKYREIKRKERQEKEEKRISIEGNVIYHKGMEYNYNPDTKEVIDIDDGEVIGKVVEEEGVPGGLTIEFEGFTTSEEEEEEDTTDEEDTDEESVDFEDISSEVQLEFVDLLLTDLDYDEAKKTGLYDSELVNDEADVLGFFNNREELVGRIDWEDLEDFVWLNESARQTYLETMRDLMEDSGAGAMIPQAEARVPKKIFKKLQDQQIGGMTKGHFHKEVPVILHGGELVIPKKHVAEVMKQSPLAFQISKIPPTWQKIKKIVK